MGWADLLQDSSVRLIIPWLGGRKIYRGGRSWRIDGRLPREFGWYSWDLQGRRAGQWEIADSEPDYGNGWTSTIGFLAGDRLVPWVFGPDVLQPIYLLEPGLDRFALVSVVMDPEKRLVYKQQLFPVGPEDRVRRAFVDKKESVDDVADVPPALDFAFKFATKQRQILEERRAELEKKRAEEERLETARNNMGTGLGRRTLAAVDFRTAAEAALKVGGAELLDARQGRRQCEMVVQYRFENRRLECVVDRTTLRIVDSGICLEDHHTREKGDTYFTLESLPPVVRQAIREGKLVVYRHVEGDMDDDGWED